MAHRTTISARAAAWEAAAREARSCMACELYERATQTVFGAGSIEAPIFMVGEQPGDVEDREGEPFVGPAGRVLHDAMDAAGLGRDEVYVTNAVKHFRWEPRGKRRIHKTPSTQHVRECHRWLEAEADAVQPDLVVLLGATACKAMAPSLRVMRDRGVIHDLDGLDALVTVHPSAVLRAAARDQAMEEFVQDLRVGADVIHGTA